MANLRFNLKVKSGPAVSTSCMLSHEKHMTFGRNNENDYVLTNDAGISRQHFEIYFDDGKCWIKDLNSRNGTYVNSHPVLSGPLKAGDEIRAGNTLLVVETNFRPTEAKQLPDQYVGPKFNLVIGDDTTVVAPRKMHSAKMRQSRIHSDAFFKLFHDLPGQAILVYGQPIPEQEKSDANFVALNENCSICYPSELQSLKTLVKNASPMSIMMLNFTSSRSQLQEHIQDHSQTFASPEQLLNSYQELPSELSNALLNGIDLVICAADTPEEVALVFEKRHSTWLSKLIPSNNTPQTDIN